MTAPIMPKATAIWLIRNTKLTFQQIANYCDLHVLEVQNLADNPHNTLLPFDPISSGELSMDEVKRCENDSSLDLKINEISALHKKQKKYIPTSIRSARPSAILWLITNYTFIPNKEIVKLLSTTTTMIENIRTKKYDISKITPQDPSKLGLCSKQDLEQLIKKYETKEV